MKNDKTLRIITCALYIIAILAMAIYLIWDMQTYHAPKIYYNIGMIFLLLASILALITAYLRKRHRK